MNDMALTQRNPGSHFPEWWLSTAGLLAQNRWNIQLSRNESIVNAAAFLNQEVLLFPDCPSGLTYNEIVKYELVARALCSMFGTN